MRIARKMWIRTSAHEGLPPSSTRLRSDMATQSSSSTHPRTRKRIDALRLEFHPLVRLLKPFGFIDYNALQSNARAVISDSGSISKAESAILGFPAVNLRDAHERPEAMELAVAMMTGLNPQRVLQALDLLERQEKRPRLPDDYAIPGVSENVVRIILSYTDYVRHVVWKDS